MPVLAVPPLLFHLGPPIAVALVVALIGPFGTYGDMGLGTRLLYWGIIIPLNWVQVELIAGWARPRIPRRWAAITATVLLAAVPATAEVAVLEALLRPEPLDLALWQLYAGVALLTAAIAVPMWLLRARQAETAKAETVEIGEGARAGGDIAFLRRIPERLGRHLLCLRTEDHYLRVFTPAGDDLILMRMRDAEAELAGTEGLRVHRSWWVARSVVRAVRRDGDRMVLELVNGLEVPVSRSHAASVRNAGWDGRA